MGTEASGGVGKPMKPYYSDEWVTIYHGDCREVLPFVGPADLILTDPPFSDRTHDNAKSNRGRGHGNKAIDFAAISQVFTLCGSLCCGWIVAFLDWRHIYNLEDTTPEPWEFMRFGVWVKTNPMPQISADRPANGWDGIAYLRHAEAKPGWSGGGRHGNYVGPVVTDGAHPTQKPVGFLQVTIQRFTDRGDAVLDPFMGSGTTLVAAKNLGRKAIGIEIEERYCEIAAQRCSQGVLALNTDGEV